MTTNNKPNYTIDLPNNYLAKKEYNHIYIEKKQDKNSKKKENKDGAVFAAPSICAKRKSRGNPLP